MGLFYLFDSMLYAQVYYFSVLSSYKYLQVSHLGTTMLWLSGRMLDLSHDRQVAGPSLTGGNGGNMYSIVSLSKTLYLC